MECRRRKTSWARINALSPQVKVPSTYLPTGRCLKDQCLWYTIFSIQASSTRSLFPQKEMQGDTTFNELVMKKFWKLKRVNFPFQEIFWRRNQTRNLNNRWQHFILSNKKAIVKINSQWAKYFTGCLIIVILSKERILKPDVNVICIHRVQ